MKLTIKYKLLLAILSGHIIVYISMYSLGRAQFNDGFIDYISRIEEQQVPALIDGLESWYEARDRWDLLRDNVSLWNIIIRDSVARTAEPGQLLEIRQVTNFRLIESAVEDRNILTNNTSAIDAFRRPALLADDDWYFSSEYSPARPHLLLLDADHDIMFGDPEALPLANLYPLNFMGETVGYLAVTSRQELSERADQLFVESQINSFFLIGIVLVVISILVAIPAASYLVRPIRDLVNGTRALTAGDYNSRIKVRSSDELGLLSEDFNTLANTLDQNQTARRQWIADISHELRTPLAILRGELEAAQDGIRPLDPASLNSWHHEVVHLNTLVNDLHELSMSDNGALVYEKEKIDVKPLLEQTLELHQNLIAQNNIKVSTVISGSRRKNKKAINIFGDPKRLKQLFDNLLQNTCRYTDEGGELKITLKEYPDKVAIDWIDSEPGVSDEDLHKLFDRLYRVESSRNREKGGSGLGLAICKNIVEAHEGCITAEHSELGGLKLRIELPKRQKS
ncbi:HAMP domain-containing protein [Haliea sp. AH-315-K21]|uniref:histidine kinase n=1 Tax=SAR86 cluster bacterium TaxID=2030880 RepID=A0A2A5CDA4_9GAMM|nr:HAMP domain-containing protein [Haliea sp. AH-315-K21]MBN4075509.1 HAMP domain-containing protein [Gammaproteobacteria bacterium AH-315-E17]PCJ41819.1 MAG: two-component sensor histidine kinase [SAR86 cluster bacterium]PCJ43804.1 MAG: two-component sensor histidine kinase [SAR86 cluster bacterium]